MSRSTLAKNIQKARKLKKWTQEQAARQIGVKRSTWGSYEEGRAEPPNKVLTAMVEAFNVEDDYYGFINNRDFYDKFGKRRSMKTSEVGS